MNENAQQVPTALLESQDSVSNVTQYAEVDQKWLEKLEQILKGSLRHHQLTMEDITESLNMGKRQLSRKLKQLTGLNPLKYQREI